MKTYRATYSTETIKNINYDFNAEDQKAAEDFASNKFESTNGVKVVEINPETLLPVEFTDQVELVERQMNDVQEKVINKESLSDYEEVLYKFDTSYSRRDGAKKMVRNNLVKF
ncbi:hypothetical protein [Salinimicrobium sp. WS361]|uniref:hypothetical protein n=1 Tax=Salinimicrobium sp. WS361 TaxID=3425123 RepID=UPI003D6EB206